MILDHVCCSYKVQSAHQDVSSCCLGDSALAEVFILFCVQAGNPAESLLPRELSASYMWAISVRFLTWSTQTHYILLQNSYILSCS